MRGPGPLSVFRAYLRLIFSQQSDRLKYLLCVSSILTKPGNHKLCVTVDVTHQIDLTGFFCQIRLVDAYRIDPHMVMMLELRATKLQECLGQVQRDANETSAVDEQERAL